MGWVFLNILFIVSRDKFSSGFINYMKKYFTRYSLHFIIRDHGREQFPLNLLDYDIFNTEVEVKWCYNEECSKIITKFFEKRRNK